MRGTKGRKSWLLGGFHGKLAPLFPSHLYFVTARARAASPRYCRCKNGITLDITPWVYIPSDIFGTTNILTGFYEASSGKRIYGGTSQCIRFTCFPIRRDRRVISSYRYTEVSDKYKFHEEATLFPKLYSLLAHHSREIKKECMRRIRTITLKLHVKGYEIF